MKKCPKCGTILDDSKKQCYMCGTNLDLVKVDLTENKQIGAVVSGGQDNVFNNGEDIKFKGKDVVKKNNDSAYFSHDSHSKGFFNEDLNSLNSQETDHRSKLQKSLDSIFGNKKFSDGNDASSKKKKETTKNVPVEQEQKRGPQARNKRVNEEISNQPNSQPPKPMDSDQELINKIMFDDESTKDKNDISQTEEVKSKNKKDNIVEEKEEKKKRSFGFLNEVEEESGHDFGFTKEPKQKAIKVKTNKPSITDTFKKKVSEISEKMPKKEKVTRGYKDGGGDSLKFNGQMFFNLIAIIAFIGVLYFVWNFVINKKADTSLSGLVYEMNSSFKLKSKDSYSRYYVYNDACTIKINTSTNNSVENYIKNIKDTYGNDPDAMVMFEELKINDYMWSSLGIYYYDKGGNEIGGKTPLARYRYTSILNKGDFFAIIFVNTYEDSDCQDKYNEFVKTLNFKEG